MKKNDYALGIAVSDDLFNWKKVVFPIVNGHDAEIIQNGKNKWNLYYAPYCYFDMPNADVRLAIYEGNILDVQPCQLPISKN